MSPQHQSYRNAGYAAVLAGFAWVIWGALNTLMHGALEIGDPAVEPRLLRGGQLLMVAWNLLLLPGALVLYVHLKVHDGERVLLATVCGLSSLLFWGYGAATHTTSPILEVSCLVLSALWWLALGPSLRREHPFLGVLTIVLGGFALWDAVLSALEPVPLWLYVSGAPRLPLSVLWDFALGATLIRMARAPGPG